MRPDALSNVDDRFREGARGGRRSASHLEGFNLLCGNTRAKRPMTERGAARPSDFNARGRS